MGQLLLKFSMKGGLRGWRKAGQSESVLASREMKKSLFCFHNLIELSLPNDQDGLETGFDDLCKRKNR